MIHFNYAVLLPRLVPIKKGSNRFAIAGKKLLVDQTLAAPIMNTAFFIAIRLFDGSGLQAGIDDCFNGKYGKLWKATQLTWLIWVPTNGLNFAFVPVRYQFLVDNCVSLLYNVCLSYIHNNNHSKEEQSSET